MGFRTQGGIINVSPCLFVGDMFKKITNQVIDRVNKSKITRLLLSISLFVMFLIVVFRPIIAYHGSDPHKFFIRIPFKKPVKGDYVSAVINRGGIEFPLIKKVAGVPGDNIQIKENDIFINTNYLCAQLKETIRGSLLPKPIFPKIIPNNNFFLFSPHIRSFDSRYMGLINIGEIDAVVYPLF
jgi:hypothetical protein